MRERIALLIAAMLPSAACVDVIADSGGPTADGGITPQSLRCASDAVAPIDRFQVCFGSQFDPGLVPLGNGVGIAVDGFVTEFDPDIRFASCTARDLGADDVLTVQSDDNRFALAIVAERNGEPLMPPLALETGTPVHVEWITDGFVGGHSIFASSPGISVAGVSLGLVDARQDDMSVARGGADGPSESNDCGEFQRDLFDVEFGGTSEAVRNGQCANLSERAIFVGVLAFHFLSSECTDSRPGFNWAAMWQPE